MEMPREEMIGGGPNASEIQEYVADSVGDLKELALESKADRELELKDRLETFDAISEELAHKRRKLSEAEVELESLPGQAYRANLDGEPEEESRLRTRYRQVKDDVPALRSRIEELAQEAGTYYSAQNAKSWGVDEAVRHQQRSELAPAKPTAELRAELLKLRADVLEALDSAITELSPDTADAVRLKRELDKQREAARKARPQG